MSAMNEGMNRSAAVSADPPQTPLSDKRVQMKSKPLTFGSAATGSAPPAVLLYGGPRGPNSASEQSVPGSTDGSSPSF